MAAGNKQPGSWIYKDYIDATLAIKTYERRRQHTQPQTFDTSRILNGLTVTTTTREDLSKNAAWQVESSITPPGLVVSQFITDEQNKIVTRVMKQTVLKLGTPTDLGCVLGNVCTFINQPANAEQITAGPVTYQFADAAHFSNDSNKVLIGDTLIDTLNNLVAAISKGTGSGIVYAASTTANPNVSAWNTATELIAVSTTGAAIATTDTVANASWSNGIWAAAASTTAINMFVEYQPVNEFVAVRLTSYVVKLPDTEVYWSTKMVSLPDTLTDIVAYVGEATAGGAGADGGDISGNASASCYFDISPNLQITPGYNGPAQCKITLSYKITDPVQADIAGITKIQGAVGTLVTKTIGQSSQVSANEGGGVQCNTGANVQTKGVRIGPLLTNGKDYSDNGTDTVHASSTGGSVVANAYATGSWAAELSIPASTPASIAPGDTIGHGVYVDKLKLNVFVLQKVEIVVP